MTILLQHPTSAKFQNSAGTWIDDVTAARVFGDSLAALNHAFKHAIGPANILWKHNDPRYDFSVRHNFPLRDVTIGQDPSLALSA